MLSSMASTNSGREPGPEPAGFGYGCSLEEHITYGQCLDGLCSSRGNWEAVATRQASTLKATRRRQRRTGRRAAGGRTRVTKFDGSVEVMGGGSVPLASSSISTLDTHASGGVRAGESFGGFNDSMMSSLSGVGKPVESPLKSPSVARGAGAGAGAAPSTTDSPAGAELTTPSMQQSSVVSPLRTSQFESLLKYSQPPSILKPRMRTDGGDSDGSSVAYEEEIKGDLDVMPSKLGASTSASFATGGGKGGTGGKDSKGSRGGVSSVVLRIPADSEAPFGCFPMQCLQCEWEVPLRNPVRRVMLANKRVIRKHRALLESTMGQPNKALLRTAGRRRAGTGTGTGTGAFGRSTMGRSSGGFGGGTTRRRRADDPPEPPVLYLPGGGYMCSPACLKKFVLSKASPEVAKVTKGKNTRRIALLDATKRNELDKVSALLVSGAHINIADDDGKTPLHIACELGDPVLVDRLLQGAFNVLTFTNCQAHHHKACTCFNQRPNLDKPDVRGYTPLHCAAAIGKIGIVEKLVAAGADSQAEDNKGMAPQDVAGSQDCFAVLRLNSRVVQDGDRLRTMQLRGEALERTLGATV